MKPVLRALFQELTFEFVVDEATRWHSYTGGLSVEAGMYLVASAGGTPRPKLSLPSQTLALGAAANHKNTGVFFVV